MIEDQIVHEMNENAKTICGTYWSDRNGLPSATCCRGCPIIGTCYSWYPTTIDGINKHTDAMNAEADRVATLPESATMRVAG